jgi:uncharacterized protein YfaS (alpha-2-macroglobulin family)
LDHDLNLTGEQGISPNKFITSSLELLNARQNDDGGWGWWTGDSHLNLTSYSTLGLIYARSKGYPVPAANFNKVQEYFTSVITETISENSHDASTAFALYILSLLDREWPAQIISDLYIDRNQLDISSQAYLALALGSKDPADTRIHTIIEGILDNAITDNEGIHWLAEDNGYMLSDTQTTALVLYMLQRLDTEVDTLPFIVNWLIKNRKGNHWQTPYETAWALIALHEYYNNIGIVKPSFDWNVKLNNQVLVDSTAQSMTDFVISRKFEVNDPSGTLFFNGKNQIEYSRGSGLGTMYYATELDTVNVNPGQNNVYKGLRIEREYCSIQNESRSQSRYLRSDCVPVTTVFLNEEIDVRLTVYNSEMRHNVTVEDVYPAGFRSVFIQVHTMENSSGAAAHYASRLEDGKHFGFYLEELLPGVYQFTYRIKATFPGVYNAIPAKIFETYNPVIWAQSNTNVITVKQN